MSAARSSIPRTRRPWPTGLSIVASATLWMGISADTSRLRAPALVAAPQSRNTSIAEPRTPPATGPDQQQARALFEEGLRSLEQNRYQQAIEGFQRSLKLDPSLLTARYDLGVAYFSQGQFDQAKQAFQEVLEQSPRYPFARYFLGRTDLVQGDSGAAIREFRAISGERPVADELYYLGSAYFRKGDIPEAIRTLKRAASRKPEDYRVHLLLARALERDGHQAEAEREYAASERLRVEYRVKARDMTECESLLQKHDEDAIERCRTLLDGNDTVKLTSLGTL